MHFNMVKQLLLDSFKEEKVNGSLVTEISRLLESYR